MSEEQEAMYEKYLEELLKNEDDYSEPEEYLPIMWRMIRND